MPNDPHPTLADAIAALEQTQTIPALQRRDVISAISRVATYLNRSPHDLEIDAASLRNSLAKIHPAQAGVSAKTLSNVKNNLMKALQATGHLRALYPKCDPTDGWKAFLAQCTGKHQVHSFSRLLNYCCALSIEPDDLSDQIMPEFEVYLDERVLAKDPAELCKQIAQAWNGIVNRQGLPLAQLSYQRGGQYRAPPLTSYPASLQAEINGYLDKLAHADPFDDDSPDVVLKPVTLRNIRAHLRQYLDALVQAGNEPANMTTLKSVVTAEMMKAAYQVIMDRLGHRCESQFPPTLHNISGTLVAIARHHLALKPKKLDRILKIKNKVTYNPSGMTAKNAKRVAQFDDWHNQVLLMSLPEVLMDRAAATKNKRKSGLLAMYATAMIILLACPMRIKNLASLDIDQHLTPHKNGTHTTYTLRIEGREVKNLEAIEVRLSHKNSQLVHRYIDRFRHLVSIGNGSALFPQANSGCPRDPANFGREIKETIYRETGLHVNAHLFRHLAAYFFLREHPGEYETIRQLLKHRKQQTTMEFYAGFASKWSYDRYDDAVLSKFGGHNG